MLPRNFSFKLAKTRMISKRSKLHLKKSTKILEIVHSIPLNRIRRMLTPSLTKTTLLKVREARRACLVTDPKSPKWSIQWSRPCQTKILIKLPLCRVCETIEEAGLIDLHKPENFR